MIKNFASDNTAGAHPLVMDALVRANEGHTAPYGNDACTAEAYAHCRRHFGKDSHIFFVFAGTAANVLALRGMCKPCQAVMCADIAHINTDECGAPEAMGAMKLLALASRNGKLAPADFGPALAYIGNGHHAQPGVLSIAQTTEYGTVYTVDEVRALADMAHAHDMLLHMDGARLANAAASLGVSLRALTRDAGVDVLSFGGTKNGLAFGDAVVVLNESLVEGYKYLHKQYGQLYSKMRFLGAQFSALLKDDLWLSNARHANAMAQRLVKGISGAEGVIVTQNVQANAIFARMPEHAIHSLQKEFLFNLWDPSVGEVRLMTSFATTPEQVDAFAQAILKACRI